MLTNGWVYRGAAENERLLLREKGLESVQEGGVAHGDGSISVAELQCDYNPFQASIAAFPTAIDTVIQTKSRP